MFLFNVFKGASNTLWIIYWLKFEEECSPKREKESKPQSLFAFG